MIQKTKIVATLGPATEKESDIENLIKSGVSVFRLNLKHNDHSWHQEMIVKIKKISNKLDRNISIIADLQGPELRTQKFDNAENAINLKTGDQVIFGNQPIKNYLYIPFYDLDKVDGIKKGHLVFIDDGKVELKVISVGQGNLKAEVINGGTLGGRKSISIPNTKINLPTLTDKDKNDLKFAISMDTDYLSISFVRTGSDVKALRNMIKKEGGNQLIISKIETLQAIEDFDEILEESDAIMIGRGDLGVEIPIEKVPRVQKELIQRCREKAKPVIVATQMLKSMVTSPIPTRAEVADIANAVFDKTDALMLSEETTIGEYPIKTVSTMSKIARYNEISNYINDIEFEPSTYEEIIISSSVTLGVDKPSKEDNVSGYIVFTESGKSAKTLSRFRLQLPIYAFSHNKRAVSTLPLSWNVRSFYTRLHKNPITNIKNALYILKVNNIINSGDKFIVIFGNHVGIPEANNSLSIVVA